MAFRDRVKALWNRDKEKKAAEEAKGVSNTTGGIWQYLGGLFGGGSKANISNGVISLEQDIIYKYIDYENMDDYPETSEALDKYSNDSTIPDSVHNKTIWATSRDKIVRDILDDLLHRRINIEDDIWIAVRNLCKYGNLFGELLINETGVVGINWLPTPTVRRIADEKGNLLGFVQDVSGSFGFNYKSIVDLVKKGNIGNEKDLRESGLILFKPWEIVHWRLRSRNISQQYGQSIFDAARWVWKRLVLMEDTALVQKLLRAPGRYAFYVDTGTLPPRQAAAEVKRARNAYKKQRLIDPSTGKLDSRYNPLSPHEDFWFSIGEGRENSRVEAVSGIDVQMMDDVKYFNDKLMKTLNLPKEDEDISDRALSFRDAQFARVCMRIQREFIVGMVKVAKIHLATLNIDPDSAKWELRMSVPSAIFEMQQIEVMNARTALAGSMSEWLSKPFILQRVLKFTEDDAIDAIKEKIAEIDAEAKRDADTQSEIMRLHPELQQDMLQPGPEQAGESVRVSKELIGLRKIMQEHKDISVVLEEIRRLGSRVGKIEKVVKRPILENRRPENVRTGSRDRQKV